MGRPIVDYSGERFGRLVVQSMFRKNGRTFCVCLCDCGKTHNVRIDSIKKTGETRSCGCLSKDIIEGKVSINKTHGMSYSLLYSTWDSMKKRCLNPKSDQFHNYGGRGIKIFSEWIESFESFRQWSFANGYKEGLTIDRIDVDGDYTPDNCRWFTIKQQANNKRNNVFQTYKGEKLTLAQIADEMGIGTSPVYYRYYKKGLRDEELIKSLEEYKSTPR